MGNNQCQIRQYIELYWLLRMQYLTDSIQAHFTRSGSYNTLKAYSRKLLLQGITVSAVTSNVFDSRLVLLKAVITVVRDLECDRLLATSQ